MGNGQTSGNIRAQQSKMFETSTNNTRKSHQELSIQEAGKPCHPAPGGAAIRLHKTAKGIVGTIHHHDRLPGTERQVSLLSNN